MFTRSILIQIGLVMVFVVSSLCTVQGMGSNEKLSDQSQPTNNQEKKQNQLINKETNTRDYAPGQLLVKFEDGTDIQAIMAIQAEMHLEIIKLVYKPNVYLMKVLDNSSVESVMERLRLYKEVIYSEPNYIRKID